MPLAGVRLEKDRRLPVPVAMPEGHPVRCAPDQSRQTGCRQRNRAADAPLQNMDGDVVLLFALDRLGPFYKCDLACGPPTCDADAGVRSDDNVSPVGGIPDVQPVLVAFLL